MVEQLKQLYEKFIGLLTQSSPSLLELQKALDEIEKVMQSQEYKSGIQDGSIDIGLVGKLKKLQAALKEKVDELNFHQNGASGGGSQQSATSDTSKSEKNKSAEGTASMHKHNDMAQKLMNDADDLYWRGKWQEAYDLYEQVLVIEPDWPRAQEYVQKAKYNYENRVGIPKAAIPDTVKLPFARAESASSRWELENAKTFVDIAKSEASKLGLGQWDDLTDLVSRIENNIDIQKSFETALSMPESQIDEAIEKVSVAFEQSKRPLYAQKLDDLKKKKAKIFFDEGIKLFKLGRLDEALAKIDDAVKQQQENLIYSETYSELSRFKETQQEIRQYLETPKIVAAQFIEIENRFKYIQSILAKYPEAASNQPTIRELQIRFDAQRPLVLSDIKASINTAQKRFESATKIDDAEMTHTEAAESLNLYARLGADQNEIKRFTERKDNRQIEIEKITSDVETLSQKASFKKKFSKDEAERATELLGRFPNDASVKKLQKPLQSYETQSRVFIIGIIIGVMIVVSILSFMGLNAWKGYVLSLTPTATLTLTPTSTLTPTPTLPPTSTPLPSATPLPTKMQVLRDLYARSGCYEKFKFTGRIPEGAVVTLLPSERKIDDLKRECILVEYQNSDESVVGWVLLLDLGAINR